MTKTHLHELITRDDVDITEVAAALDAVSHEQRMDAARDLGRDEQRLLYRKSATASITLAHFVPPDRAPLEPVRHYGRNTLPLPSRHRSFEKRFCRPAGDGSRLFGYNEAPSRALVGPGYFVVAPTESNPEFRARGGIVIDYFQVPDGPVPEGWPKVVPNSRGIQFFVYHRTRDFMRRVSEHVSIGAAYKVEKALDHYFVLVRE